MMLTLTKNELISMINETLDTKEEIHRLNIQLGDYNSTYLVALSPRDFIIGRDLCNAIKKETDGKFDTFYQQDA